jgi:hypothetical protein
MNLIILYFYSHLLEFILLIIGSLYGYGLLKNKKDVDTLNDDSRWRSALDIRNTEISDLNAQIIAQAKKYDDLLLAQSKRYDATIVSLQSQITALSLQVKTLQEKNDVLVNTISGRDILETVVADQNKIAESINRFDILLSKDGLLNKFIQNDNLIMAGIEDIKKNLEMNKRIRDRRDK